MKKISICLITLFVTMTSFAQNTPNTISVSGNYSYTVQPELTAKMILSLSNVYYDAPGLNLPELKSTYLNNISKAGLDKNMVKEDELAYAMMGYEKEGVILEFKTKSLEQLKTFLNVKALGVSKSDASIEFTLTDDEMANYAKLAYDNAKSKAEAIAKKIGRTVGKAIYISDSNNNKVSESLYYATDITSRDYYLTVSFELL